MSDKPLTDAEILAVLEKVKARRSKEICVPDEFYLIDQVIDSLRVRVEAAKYDGLSKCCKSEFTVVYDPDRQYECCKCDARCEIYEDKDHA